MERSPCLKCDLLHEDKKNPICGNCDDRLQYIATLGRPNESLRIEMADMTIKRKPWTQADDEFIQNNYQTMKNRQLGERLDRTESAVWARLNKLQLKRCPQDAANRKIKHELPNRDLGDSLPVSHRVEEMMSPGEMNMPALAENAPMVPSKDFMVVDFSMYGDLFDKVMAAAAEEFRTPQLQILFYCHQALNGQTAK